MLLRVLEGVKRRSLLRSPLRIMRLLLGARLNPIRVWDKYIKPHKCAALSGSVGVGCTEPCCCPEVSYVVDSHARICAVCNLIGWTVYVREAVELSR
jgi:hypothetical protein